MAKISETELQRRLKSLEKKTAFSLKIVISDIDPVGTDHAEGSEHYNSTTGNLYIFSNGAWELTATKLHIMYATVVTNLSEEGIAPSQGDVTGFSELPYTSGGLQKDYRGIWFGGRAASTDPTDYTWTLTAGEEGYSPIKGIDYDDGISGNNIRVEYSTDGLTWVVTQVQGTDYLYIRTSQDTNNNGIYIPGIASKFVPEKGVEYDDGGTVAQLTIYKRSATALATPTGGQYNFGTHTLTTPAGWTSSIPTGTDPVYSSVTLANIIGNTGTDTTLTWSSPESILSDGVAGTSVYTTNVFLRKATAPGTPVTDTGSFAFGTNILTAPTGSPASELWLISIPTGSDPLYASEATFSISGDTGTDSTVDWGTPRIVAQDGETGLSGLSTYLYSVFQRSATIPATPTTGSYNFTTNTPTAPSGWFVEVPSGTDPLYVTTTLASTTGPTGEDNTLTWSSPTIMAQDGYSPIKGTDYDDGIDGNNVRVEYSVDEITWVTNQVSNTVYLYIRTAVDTNNNGTYVPGESTKFVPVKGVEYDDGDPGTDAYVHIKYSNDGLTFTANSGEDVGSWIGTLSDSTLADSTTFNDYTWKEIVGADGYTPIKNTDYFDGTSSYLHIKYSNDGTTFTGNGGEDIGSWIGTLSDSTIADSTTFGDYAWQKVAGDTPTFERYYSNTAGLASEMGDPTTPGAGITWISISTSATTPSTAYWVAERYTLSGVVTSWQIYPVQAKDSGIPFVTYTKAGFNMPVLGDSTWITDAVAAVTAFTGRPYTNQKEFGYGTVVVITYDNGKLYGTYKRSGSVDTWTTPASFIDGDLIVDGTIAADHMQANSIDATKLVVTGLNPIIASTIGADTAGSAATAESNAIAASDPVGSASTAQSNAIAASDPVGSASTAQSNAISTSGTNADAKVAVVTDNIYTTSTTTIDGGKITTGSVTATQITATSLSAITADLGTITTGKLENTDSSFVIDLTNKTMYIR